MSPSVAEPLLHSFLPAPSCPQRNDHNIFCCSNGDICFFRHSQLFLQFRDGHFQVSLFSSYLSISQAVSPKTTRRLRLSSTATHWLSSSLDDGELCCGIGVFLWTRRSIRHFSLLLNVMPHYLPTFLRCCLESPIIVFCFPRSGPFSLLCQKAGQYYCLLSSSTSKCTSKRPLHSSGSIKRSKASMSTSVWMQFSRYSLLLP